MKSFLKIITALLFAIVMSIFISSASGVHPGIVAAAIIALSFYPLQSGLALSAISVTALTTALGAFFKANKQIIFSEILLGNNIRDRFEVYDGVKDELPLPNLAVADLVKPGNDLLFQPTANALAFGARILKVRNWKVDLLIVPNALEKTWLGQYYDKGSRNYKLPFEQFVMNYIAAKIQENLRLQSVWRGVYNASGTTPIDIMNGVLKLIVDEITATNITPVTTGAITSTNALDKAYQVYDVLGEAYKASATAMYLNSTIFDWITRKFQPIINASLVSTDVNAMADRPRVNEFPLPGTNCTIFREPGLGASQRIICTPKENLVYGCDSFGEENNIEAQKFERTIKLMIDAKSGVQLKEIHSRALAVNEQA